MVVDGYDVLRGNQVLKLVKKMCTVKIWGKGVERGLGVSWTRRKWRKTAAGEVNSGDEILRPGGTVRRGMKGKNGGGLGLLIGQNMARKLWL